MYEEYLRKRVGLEATALSNESASQQNVSGSNSTTTYVDVLIQQNTTTFQNVSETSSIPKLDNETTVNLLTGSSTLPWTLWDGNVLWISCWALLVCTALVLGLMALRRNDDSFECRSLNMLAFKYLLASMGYLIMALGEGHLQEVYAVEVFEGVTETPGQFPYAASTPAMSSALCMAQFSGVEQTNLVETSAGLRHISRPF